MDSYEAAKKAADKVGGQVAWSSAKGWYVEGGTSSGISAPTGTIGPVAGGGDTSYWSGGTSDYVVPRSSPSSDPFAGARGMGSVGFVGEGGGGDDVLQQLLDEMGIGETPTLMGPQGGFDTPFPGGAEAGQIVTLSSGATGFWTRDELGWPMWNGLTAGTQPISAAEQAQLDMMQQQMEMDWQQLEAQLAMQERQLEATQKYQADQLALAKQQYGAQLAAQPHSWLEYSAFTGDTPVVQPWMTPLSPGDYPQLQAGQAIPGYNKTDMTGMPDLLRPSQQYYARMGPTAQQQYLGYQQADTGAPLQESLWRQEQYAPPSGRFAGLSRRR